MLLRRYRGLNFACSISDPCVGSFTKRHKDTSCITTARYAIVLPYSSPFPAQRKLIESNLYAQTFDIHIGARMPDECLPRKESECIPTCATGRLNGALYPPVDRSIFKAHGHKGLESTYRHATPTLYEGTDCSDVGLFHGAPQDHKHNHREIYLRAKMSCLD